MRAAVVDTSCMWVTEDGVAHTVALPNPQQLMTENFRRALDQLHSKVPVQVEKVLDQAEDSLFSDGGVTPDDPDVLAQYEGCPPPVKILRGLCLFGKSGYDRRVRSWPGKG